MGVRCTTQIVPHVHPNIKHTNPNLSFFLISRCCNSSSSADYHSRRRRPPSHAADADHRRCPPPASQPPSGEAASVAMEKQPSDVGGGCNGRRKKMEWMAGGVKEGDGDSCSMVARSSRLARPHRLARWLLEGAANLSIDGGRQGRLQWEVVLAMGSRRWVVVSAAG
ncbi:hypothetical protein Dimus_007692, partial [Dionaea muscipula]